MRTTTGVAGGVAALLLAACGSTGPRAGATAGTGTGATATEAAATVAPPQRIAAPPVEITWEALAVERDQFANPRIPQARRPQRGVVPTQKIILVNDDHPIARRSISGHVAKSQDGITVAVLSDEEMATFLSGMEQAGFFRAARPTSGMEAHFARDDARGRITVDRGGDSVSIVSMRGQGLNEQTRHIPALYSQLKQSIAVMRNRTPTLSVTAIQRESLR
jgi:hypothetical protein